LEGAAKVYVTVPLVITLPTKTEVPAPESVYRAKLCGIPLSLLLKLRVTLAFTGTVMVDLSNAIPEAVRLTVTADPTGAAVEAVGALLEVVGLELVKGGIVIEVEGGTGVVDVEDEEQPASIIKVAARVTRIAHFNSLNIIFIDSPFFIYRTP